MIKKYDFLLLYSETILIFKPICVYEILIYTLYSIYFVAGFHFHLAATINAETDIPLVPSINSVSEQNFVIHWLNNKEMFFTSEAENILLEVYFLCL